MMKESETKAETKRPIPPTQAYVSPLLQEEKITSTQEKMDMLEAILHKYSTLSYWLTSDNSILIKLAAIFLLPVLIGVRIIYWIIRSILNFF